MMLFNIALFGSLLLAPIARAAPYIGDVYISPPESVLSVIGGITVPTTLNGSPGDYVIFSVGLDGYNTGCNGKPSFLLGVKGYINVTTGQPSHQAVFHEPSLGDGIFESLPMDAPPGDYIIMAVAIDPNDTTSGYGIIENVNSTEVQDVHFKFQTGDPSPCGSTGGWFIQVWGNIDFGETAHFQYAKVNTSAGMYYPSDPSYAKISDMTDPTRKVLYSLGTNGETITVQHG